MSIPVFHKQQPDLGHSLRVEDACVSLAVGAFLMQIMHWGSVWKSWPRCSDTSGTFDAISPDRSAWFNGCSSYA
jgi:hypothetical protein